jgi:hypothetical protein
MDISYPGFNLADADIVRESGQRGFIDEALAFGLLAGRAGA